MAKVSTIALVALAVAAVLMAEPGQAAIINCNDATKQLAPCAAYLTGGATDPTAACCKGVQFIKDNAKTREERREACRCLKKAAGAIVNLKDSAAKQLPTKCKIPINVPISKTVDCNTLG